jgi:hypothetical protein
MRPCAPWRIALEQRLRSLQNRLRPFILDASTPLAGRFFFRWNTATTSVATVEMGLFLVLELGMKLMASSSFRHWLRHWVLVLAVISAVAPRVAAQYFSENFDNVGALWGNGWAQVNNSIPPGAVPNWFQGDPGIFTAYDGADTAYVGASYASVSGANTISNWLFTPTRTFANGEKITFWTRTVANPNYPDRMQVRMSLNGASVNVGTTSGSVGDFTTLLLAINPNLSTTGYPNAWTEYTIIISGLAAPTSGRVAFRYFVGNGGPGGANSEYIGMDNFSYFLPPVGDLKMRSIKTMEYTRMPERHPFAGPLMGRIENFGSTTVTNATMEVRVYNGQGTQVYTSSSAPIASMAPGDIDTALVAAPTGLAPDSYTLAYIAKHTAFDAQHLNDTLYDHFTITPLQYARDNGVVVGAIGIGGAYHGGHVGQQFHFNQADNLDSIWVHVTKGYTGRPIAAAVWDMAAGQPNQILGWTDTLTYTTDAAADYVLALHNGPLQLPAGDFVVTVMEFDSTLHIGLAADVFTLGTTWLNIPTAQSSNDWENVERFGLAAYKHPQMIRLILAACDMTIVTSATPESQPGASDATASVVASGGTPPYTYLWSTGAVTPAIGGLGTNPVAVTVTDASGCTSASTVSLLVGIDGTVQTLEYGAFPNPNDGSFRVFLLSSASTDVVVTITNILGQSVYEDHAEAVTAYSQVVNLRDVAAGLYLIHLDAGDTRRQLKVLVAR